MAKMLSDLKLYSGHIDDIRFCPYHENAVEENIDLKIILGVSQIQE